MAERFKPENDKEIGETGYLQCDGDCDEKDVRQTHTGNFKCVPRTGSPPCAKDCECLPFGRDSSDPDNKYELVDRELDDSFDKKDGWSYRCWCVKKKPKPKNQ